MRENTVFNQLNDELFRVSNGSELTINQLEGFRRIVSINIL
jgi:hypothetical protein